MVLVLHIDPKGKMFLAPTLIAGYQSLAISHRVNLICVDAKLGEKIDVHGPTPSRLVAFIVGVLETWEDDFQTQLRNLLTYFKACTTLIAPSKYIPEIQLGCGVCEGD